MDASSESSSPRSDAPRARTSSRHTLLSLLLLLATLASFYALSFELSARAKATALARYRAAPLLELELAAGQNLTARQSALAARLDASKQRAAASDARTAGIERRADEAQGRLSELREREAASTASNARLSNLASSIDAADPFFTDPTLRPHLSREQRSARYLTSSKGRNTFATEILSWEPRVVLYRQFITPEEIDALEATVAGHLSRSQVVKYSKDGLESNTSKVDSGRTSDGTFLSGTLRTPLVMSIEERLANATRLPLENGEDFYYLRYKKGQQYLPHTDYCYRAPASDSEPPGSALDKGCLNFMASNERAHLSPKEQYADRYATAIISLRAPDAGGETGFPNFQRSKLPRNEGFTSACGRRERDWMSDADTNEPTDNTAIGKVRSALADARAELAELEEAEGDEGEAVSRRRLASVEDDFEAASRREAEARERAEVAETRRKLTPSITTRGEGAIPWPGAVMSRWRSNDATEYNYMRGREQPGNYPTDWCDNERKDGRVLRVSPAPGDMLLFYNFNDDGSNDGAALHGGCPVTEGSKHILTKWLRSRATRPTARDRRDEETWD